MRLNIRDLTGGFKFLEIWFLGRLHRDHDKEETYDEIVHDIASLFTRPDSQFI